MLRGRNLFRRLNKHYSRNIKKTRKAVSRSTKKMARIAQTLVASSNIQCKVLTLNEENHLLSVSDNQCFESIERAVLRISLGDEITIVRTRQKT